MFVNGWKMEYEVVWSIKWRASFPAPAGEWVAQMFTATAALRYLRD